MHFPFMCVRLRSRNHFAYDVRWLWSWFNWMGDGATTEIDLSMIQLSFLTRRKLNRIAGGECSFPNHSRRVSGKYTWLQHSTLINIIVGNMQLKYQMKYCTTFDKYKSVDNLIEYRLTVSTMFIVSLLVFNKIIENTQRTCLEFNLMLVHFSPLHLSAV